MFIFQPVGGTASSSLATLLLFFQTCVLIGNSSDAGVDFYFIKIWI